MGKAKIRKKRNGLLKQTRKHISKLAEAKKRGDTGSMEYMAREMSDYLRQIEKMKLRLLPRKRKVRKKA